MIGWSIAIVGGACALAVVLSQGRLLAWLVARLPHRALLGLGRGLGALLRLLGVRRQVALANLRQAFPERDEAWRRATLRAFYDHLGLLIAEFFRAPYLPAERLDELVEVEGFDRFLEQIGRAHV